jgi:hypothetical protein
MDQPEPKQEYHTEFLRRPAQLLQGRLRLGFNDALQISQQLVKLLISMEDMFSGELCQICFG